jgi:hypothetical protein
VNNMLASPPIHIIIGVGVAILLLVLIGCTIYACRCGRHKTSSSTTSSHTHRVTSVLRPPPPNCPPPNLPHANGGSKLVLVQSNGTPRMEHGLYPQQQQQILNSYKSTPSPRTPYSSSTSAQRYATSNGTYKTSLNGGGMTSSAYHQFDPQCVMPLTAYDQERDMYEPSPQPHQQQHHLFQRCEQQEDFDWQQQQLDYPYDDRGRMYHQTVSIRHT